MAASDVWNLPLSNSLQPCHITDFTHLPDDIVNNLSPDQKYLYQICVAVIDGIVPETLQCSKIRNLCHSRWLTLANRIMRIYVSLETSSKYYETIIYLVKYIVGVYYKTFAAIKYKPSLADGPLHLHNQIKYIKSEFDGDELVLLLESVQNNCTFAHPENLIIAMMCSDNIDAMRQAINIISSIRKFPLDSFEARQFILPKVKTRAPHYNEMCHINLLKR